MSARVGIAYGMRASRIFAFARTIRCAIVGGVDRNARATCSVVRSHTSRSVSAIRASALSAGWQQVKMSRSQSSSSDSSSSSGCAACRCSSPSAIDDRLASNRASRRSCVDRLEPARRHEPRARVRRHAARRPLLQRRGERVVQRLLRTVEVAEQADERGEHATGLGAIDPLDRVPRVGRARLAHGHVRLTPAACSMTSMIGRTSMLPVRAPGIFAAIWIASFRSLASSR